MKLHTLRPHQHDLRFALGDLEALILRQLWATGKPLSVREFQRKVSRARPVAVTTVATILDRLYQKGIVSRRLVREGGPHYLYSARMTEDEFRHALVDNVMGTLLRNFNDVTVAYLAERMSMTNETDWGVLSKHLNRLRQRARE